MGWIDFFAVGWGLSFSVYAALQLGALLTTRGLWRVAVASPAPVMAIVLAHMVWAYFRESNLWPIFMIMVAPGAALGVLVMWVGALLTSGRRRQLILPAVICLLAGLGSALNQQPISSLWSALPTIVFSLAFVCLGGLASEIARRLRRSRPAGPIGPAASRL